MNPSFFAESMSRLLSIALVVMMTSTALANPFFIGRFGGLNAGPENDGAFATYWNPAHLGQADGHIQVHLLGVNRHATYRRTLSDDVPSDLDDVNGGENQTGALGIVPALAARYGVRLGNVDLGFGGAWFIDRAGRTHWRKNYAAPAEVPGAIDGPQRWATINTSLQILSAGLGTGVSYRPAGLSLGLTALHHMASLSTLRARNPDGSERVRDEAGRLAEGRVLLEDATDQKFSWIVGLAWAPNDDFSVSLSWHSGVDYELSGDAYVTFGVAPETEARSAFGLPVPQTVRLESRLALGDGFTIRPLLGWAQWSILDAQEAYNVANGEALMRLERNFQDIYFGRAALDMHVNSKVTLSTSVTYETGATPTETFEPGLAESDNVELGIGGQFWLTDALRLGVSFSWQQFMDVTVEQSAQEPAMNGQYTDQRQFLALDLGMTL